LRSVLPGQDLRSKLSASFLEFRKERSSRLKEPLLKALNGPLDYCLTFPIIEILHTFMAGKPPRLWVNPYLGFSS
jgi:hypothetical protein